MSRLNIIENSVNSETSELKEMEPFCWLQAFSKYKLFYSSSNFNLNPKTQASRTGGCQVPGKNAGFGKQAALILGFIGRAISPQTALGPVLSCDASLRCIVRSTLPSSHVLTFQIRCWNEKIGTAGRPRPTAVPSILEIVPTAAPPAIRPSI